MKTIGAYQAKTHLPRLLDRVARGESLTITRHGRPVARLVPVPGHPARAREAADRIQERRRRSAGVPLADLLASIHEGHQY